MSTTIHHNNKQVAKNTIYLYLRTMFVMVISIFTSRIVLDALGIDDYGIYNAVGGFVAMFSMLSGTLVAASQRFIAFELGKPDPDVEKVFSTTISVHLLLAALILILLETLGLWFLNYKMNIAAERMAAANWVYQCSVLTFCFKYAFIHGIIPTLIRLRAPITHRVLMLFYKFTRTICTSTINNNPLEIMASLRLDRMKCSLQTFTIIIIDCYN